MGFEFLNQLPREIHVHRVATSIDLDIERLTAKSAWARTVEARGIASYLNTRSSQVLHK